MRRLAALALTALLALAGVASADTLSTTACPGTGCVTYAVGSGLNYVGVQVAGTFSGTLTFQYSIDGSNFNSLSLFPDATGTAASTATAAGIWRGQLGGVGYVRVIFTAYTSGSATVTVRLDTVQMTGNVGTAFTPGGSSGDLQYNNGGAFGGIGPSNWDGTTVVLPNTTISRIVAAGGSPTVSDTSANSCGSGTETIAGTDNAGKVTVIGSAGTSCTVTFTAAFAAAPACTASNETSAQLARATSTTTTVIVAGTFAQNDVIAYVCIGK